MGFLSAAVFVVCIYLIYRLVLYCIGPHQIVGVAARMGVDGEVTISSFTRKSDGGQILVKTIHIRESGAAPPDLSELFSETND